MKESGKLECTLMESVILREKIKYNQYGLILFETFGRIINRYIEETSDFIAVCSYTVKGALRRAVVVQCINLFVATTHKRITQIFLSQDVPNASIPLKVKVKVTQLCTTLCDPKGYIVHGILQASKGSSQLRDWIQVSHIAGGFFTSWSTREALNTINQILNLPTILHHKKNAHLPIFLEIRNS